jgi:hypothetical protein
MNYPATQKTAHGKCCSDQKCETGLRNNYFEGKRLTVDSFRVEQEYLNERRRLLNRAVHGWGVVYGYAITHVPPTPTKPGGLVIGAGLALDKCGRELLNTETPIELHDLIIIDKDCRRCDLENVLPESGSDERRANGDCPRRCWLLSVHYAEERTSQVQVNDPCRCEHDEWDHTCETVRFSLQNVDCARCFERDCKCGKEPRDDEPPATDDEASGAQHRRDGCRWVCEHLTNLELGGKCDHLCTIEEACGRVRVDLHNGVPLACVELVQDGGRWTFKKWIEACVPRQLVKRNDLLFDLICDCDLTQIDEIGWSEWHRRRKWVPFDEFSEALGPAARHQHGFITKDFWVKFSRPVLEDSLRPDCFAMTAMSAEREGGWWQTFRVPIVDIDTTLVPPRPDDPPNHVRSARMVVDEAWVEDAVRGHRTIFIGS